MRFAGEPQSLVSRLGRLFAGSRADKFSISELEREHMRNVWDFSSDAQDSGALAHPVSAVDASLPPSQPAGNHVCAALCSTASKQGVFFWWQRWLTDCDHEVYVKEHLTCLAEHQGTELYPVIMDI